MFIRTIFVWCKILGDESVLKKVRVGEFPTGEIRTRSETLRGRPAAGRHSHFAGGSSMRAFARLPTAGNGRALLWCLTAG